MSDFDKEAERERLRKKYERDQEKRQATQRMSELLLQGATMTNRHCEVCGDPIFRYEGQEFCPSCQQRRPAEADEGAATGAEPETDAASEAEAGAPTVPEADETAAADGTTDPVEAARDETETADGPSGGESPEETPAGATGRTERRSREAAAESTRGPDADAVARGNPPTGADGDLDAARSSLVRTLSRLANAAEATDDPRRAREYLAAAREAAEAVAALDGR